MITAIVVATLALLAVSLVVNQLMRLKKYLDKPPPMRQDEPPEDP